MSKQNFRRRKKAAGPQTKINWKKVYTPEDVQLQQSAIESGREKAAKAQARADRKRGQGRLEGL